MNNEMKTAVEAFEHDIEKIRIALSDLRESGMKEKTILVLMHHHTGLPQRTIKAVMEGLESLQYEYFGDD